MSMTFTQIIGNLGGDPTTTEYNQTSVCNFSVAVTVKIKQQDFTIWYKCAAWGKGGEVCQQYLRKGSKIFVSGECYPREWVNQHGEKGFSMEMRVDKFKFLSSPPQNDQAAPVQAAPAEAPADEINADDIPF